MLLSAVENHRQSPILSLPETSPAETMSLRARLLELLQESPRTQKELADLLKCNVRHVRRLAGRLKAEGLLRRSRQGRHVYYELALLVGETTDVQLELTERDVLALGVAGAAATSLLEGLPLGQNLRELLQPEHLKPRFYFQAIARTRIDPHVFEAVLEALLHNCVLEIDYEHPHNGLDRGRRVNPLCLAIVGNAVQLTAWCHRRRRPTNFAMARIRAARVLEHETFARPDFDPEAYYTTDALGAVADEHYYTYRLWVSARVAHCFREREYFPGQVIEEEHPDGTLVVSYEGPGLEVMRAFVMSWGRDVQALEPPELVARIREELAALQAHYDQTRRTTSS